MSDAACGLCQQHWLGFRDVASHSNVIAASLEHASAQNDAPIGLNENAARHIITGAEGSGYFPTAVEAGIHHTRRSIAHQGKVVVGSIVRRSGKQDSAIGL